MPYAYKRLRRGAIGMSEEEERIVIEHYRWMNSLPPLDVFLREQEELAFGKILAALGKAKTA